MTEKIDSYQERLAAWERAKFAPAPEPVPRPKQPTIIEMVPMRDGVRLYTEIFLPDKKPDIDNSAAKFYPAILSRSPYPYTRPSRNDTRDIARYTDAGYAFVFQLTRGQGKSEGDFEFFHSDIADGYDCVQWVAGQGWCNGRVGMEGSSYSGSTQLLAARTKPPALKCIMPTAFVGNFTQCFPYSYGVPNKGPFMQWLQVVDAERWDDMDVAYCDMRALDHPAWGRAFRSRPLIDAANAVLTGAKRECWQNIMSSPQESDFWRRIQFSDIELADLDVPIFFTDGWYDMTVGPIDFFSRMEEIQHSRSDRYLLVGPWDHYQTFTQNKTSAKSGDRILPDNAAIDLIEQRLLFFDRYLKADENVSVQPDRVRIYITGPEQSPVNNWFHYPSFPVPETKNKLLYLHSKGNANALPGDGILSWISPKDKYSGSYKYSEVDQFTYDPNVPTSSLVESFLDRRNIEIRSDVLTYTSQPLEKALTIVGNIQLVLYASSDCPDTDWFSIITEVFPDGQSKSFHYAPPAFRARYRNGFDREEFMLPGDPYRFDISMGTAGHQIPRGNRLRLSIFSAAFPEYDPNTNTGDSAATDNACRVAQQTIIHNVGRPSHLVLPTIQI